MQFKTLSEWLMWIRSLHVKSIDLDLERVKQVANHLGILSASHVIVTVGGTNGKGSTVSALEAIYLTEGYKIGVFTSPYLFKFNEQIRLMGKPIPDEVIVKAFNQIEQARQSITLTPFEFTTLAALLIFKEAELDIAILEVGLGGRLDAVNIMDADIAIVTSIDIDHVDFLGDTREKIAREKAGIFRQEKPAICGDLNPPCSLIDEAKKIKAHWYCQNKQFGFEHNKESWNWWCEKKSLNNLPLPKLHLQNMSSALMAVELLQNKLSVKKESIEHALETVKLFGRIQVIEGDIQKILDVSHNPASVNLLANYLRNHAVKGKTLAVFSMLKDKDISATIINIKSWIDRWAVAPLDVDRAASLDLLAQCFQQNDINKIDYFSSINEAYQATLQQAVKGDRIVIFGSFHTVALMTEAL